MNYKDLQIFLSQSFKFAKVGTFGWSILNRNLYYVKYTFDNTKDCCIITASIHAREHITTNLVCKLIEDVEHNFEYYKVLKVPNLIFVPMLNPDGVELCCQGLNSVNAKYRTFLTKINGGEDFTLYKANADGVDLNTNFDAKWGSGVSNKFKPSASDYIGRYPMSEPEVKAIAKLTLEAKPIFTISYHSKGQEIYYQFYNDKKFLKRDKKIAKVIAKTTKYAIKNVQDVSGGGYKDWCVLRMKIPAVTIEVGENSLSHPIGEESLEKIYQRNKNIIKVLSEVRRIYYDK